jgi:putative ABC transport system substrate-binding protein
MAAVEQGLAEFGWVNGRNLEIILRVTNDQAQLRAYAKELVALNPDVLFAGTSSPLTVLVEETRSIPIVFAHVSDPVTTGRLTNLSRPGGNVTGFVNYEYSVFAVQLRLLTEIAPQTTRIGLMYNPVTLGLRAAREAMQTLIATTSHSKLEILDLPVQSDAEIEKAIEGLAQQPGGALQVMSDVFTVGRRSHIIALAAHHRVPAVYPFRYFVQDGGLVSYGVEPFDLYRRSASYLDRVLRGTHPGDLPIQLPTKFDTAVNAKAATALGLTILLHLQVQADEIIE